MANAQQGEIAAKIGGVERTMRFSARAIAAIESDLGGQPIGRILPLIADGSVNAMVSILQRAIKPAMSRDQALDYLDQHGMVQLGEPIRQALELCGLFKMPEEGVASENPPEATAA